MLSYYKFNEDGFTKGSEEEADFLDLENPNPEEIQKIATKHDIPPLFLSDPLDPLERPRMDQEGPNTLIIIRVPSHTARPHEQIEKWKRKPMTTTPLGIIVTEKKIVIVCRKLGLAQELLCRSSRKPRPRCPLSLIFKIFIESSTDFIHHLEHLEELTDRAELTLSRAQQNEEIMTLLTIDKTLINFSVALRSNRTIMEKLMDYPPLKLNPEELDLLEHGLTENQQAIFMADIFGQVLGSMSDAFGTIISNNLNKVVKFLTGITIILMLPTFIVGAYGMNVNLPFDKHPYAFWIIVILCFISCTLLWLFFARKKWV
ncbi:MAG: magnesium transporter CorA family protein [Deltaproteobacteria bacterium]|jgi:magnesium transporter|nr:magnesium transporter CorA family protein [Deltaproteobacteria bacterium]